MQQRWKEGREDKPSSRGRLLWDVEERICDGASELSQPKGEEAPARVCVGGMGGGGRIKFRDQPKSTSGEDARGVVFSHGRHQSGTKGGGGETRGKTACLRGRPDRVTLFVEVCRCHHIFTARFFGGWKDVYCVRRFV